MSWKQAALPLTGVLVAIAVLAFSYERFVGTVTPLDERAKATAIPVGQQLTYLMSRPILPDHPLYVLKMLRDHLALMTSPPAEVIPLRLTFANSRLTAAQLLLSRGERMQALTTLTKAEKYIFSAADLYAQLSPSQKQQVTPALVSTIQLHKQQILLLKPKFTDAQKATIDMLNAQLDVVLGRI
jgi:hypothetical protein